MPSDLGHDTISYRIRGNSRTKQKTCKGFQYLGHYHTVGIVSSAVFVKHLGALLLSRSGQVLLAYAILVARILLQSRAAHTILVQPCKQDVHHILYRHTSTSDPHLTLVDARALPAVNPKSRNALLVYTFKQKINLTDTQSLDSYTKAQWRACLCTCPLKHRCSLPAHDVHLLPTDPHTGPQRHTCICPGRDVCHPASPQHTCCHQSSYTSLHARVILLLLKIQGPESLLDWF